MLVVFARIQNAVTQYNVFMHFMLLLVYTDTWSILTN